MERSYNLELTIKGNKGAYEVTGVYRNQLDRKRYFMVDEVRKNNKKLVAGLELDEKIRQQIEDQLPKPTETISYRGHLLKHDSGSDIQDKVLAKRDYTYPKEYHRAFLEGMVENGIISEETKENFLYGVENGIDEQTNIRPYFVLPKNEQEELGVQVPYEELDIKAVKLMVACIVLFEQKRKEEYTLQSEKSYLQNDNECLEQIITYKGNSYKVMWEETKPNQLEVMDVQQKKGTTYATLLAPKSTKIKSPIVLRKRKEKELVQVLPRKIYQDLFNVIKERVDG